MLNNLASLGEDAEQGELSCLECRGQWVVKAELNQAPNEFE